MDIVKEMIKLIQQYIITMAYVCILPEIKMVSYTCTGNEYVGIFVTKTELDENFYHVHYNTVTREYKIAVYNKIDQVDINTRRI